MKNLGIFALAALAVLLAGCGRDGGAGAASAIRLDTANAQVLATGQSVYNKGTAPNVNMAMGTAMLQPAGQNQSVPTLSPYLTVRYCVVMEGVYPARP